MCSARRPLVEGDDLLAFEARVYARMRETFGWDDERIAHYLQSITEQTGWSRELVLQDAEHRCDEGPEALEPWRAEAYLGPAPPTLS